MLFQISPDKCDSSMKSPVTVVTMSPVDPDPALGESCAYILAIGPTDNMSAQH